MNKLASVTSRQLSSTTILFLFLAPMIIVLYGSFVFNPTNADNTLMYLIQIICDIISMVAMLGLWVTILLDAITTSHHRVLKPIYRGSQDFPEMKIDVLLPVAGEPIEILQETFAAVKKMDYPHETYVLDDSNLTEIKRLTHEFGFNYVTRKERHFAKSGNLNHGLDNWCNGDFFVVFDADQVPHKDFLLKVIPYMQDSEIGMVQTPQYFKNTHKFIAFGTAQAQEIFYKHVCPAKNVSNSCFCVGTNVIFRRQAIDEIGGIAKVNHSEDIWTSLKLHEAGWKTIFVNEILAEGIAPSTIDSYFRQQLRWSRGGLSMFIFHNALFVKKLSIDQKIQYFISNFFYLTGFVILFYLLSPILYLLFGVKSLQTDSGSLWLIHYLPYVGLYYGLSLMLLGKLRIATIAVAASTFFPYIMAFVSVIFSTNFKWKSTSIEEKNAFHHINWVWPHVFIMFLTMLAIIVGWYYPINYWTTLYFTIWALVNFYLLFIFVTGEKRIVKN